MRDVNTSAAVSAAKLLLKSVEAEFPKQKKNLAIVDFKKTKVALKRRSRSHDEDIEDKLSNFVRSGRGYCDKCDSIGWHDNLKYSKKQCGLMKFGNKPLDPMTTQRVVNYLLRIYSSSDDSDLDDEAIPGGPGLWAYPTLH
ncbi:unnamed protein product [Thlaspi arvense]|uniref:F-box protein At5g52880-like ARM repeats region domain-containing protein n=1 Tax=Thlaspi arvense TaxID=13288 RepID=A0AAU9STB4_THLAR|nr:unnamed protein product [Thlaspi arvense]